MYLKRKIKNLNNAACLIFFAVVILASFFVKREVFAAFPIVINDDARYTHSRNIILKLNANSVGIDAIKVKFLNSKTWTDWLPYRTTYEWRLSEKNYENSGTQGTRFVSVLFRASDGTVSKIYRDKIIYDSKGPFGSVKINKGASFTTTKSVLLNLVAKDDIAGLKAVKISNNGKKWTKWLPFNYYRKTFRWNIGNKRYGGNRFKGRKCVYVKFKDNARNISSVKKDCISYIINRYIEVDLSSQYLYLWYGGKKIKRYRISSGRPGMRTPTGNFRVLSKERNHWSVKYKLYMPYSLRFYDGLYIHELPYWPGGYREGQWHLGIPVSHGCIRLGIGPAKIVYKFAPIGTRIIIHN